MVRDGGVGQVLLAFWLPKLYPQFAVVAGWGVYSLVFFMSNVLIQTAALLGRAG